MSTYTVLNLRSDVKDSAEDFGYAPKLEARFPGDALGLQESGVSYQRLAPGERAPFGHHQKRQEELYVVVEGSGAMKLDEEVVELGIWDAVRVEPQVVRAFEAGSDGIALLAFGAPHTGQGDAEMHPDWWSD